MIRDFVSEAKELVSEFEAEEAGGAGVDEEGDDEWLKLNEDTRWW